MPIVFEQPTEEKPSGIVFDAPEAPQIDSGASSSVPPTQRTGIVFDAPETTESDSEPTPTSGEEAGQFTDMVKNLVSRISPVQGIIHTVSDVAVKGIQDVNQRQKEFDQRREEQGEFEGQSVSAIRPTYLQEAEDYISKVKFSFIDNPGLTRKLVDVGLSPKQLIDPATGELMSEEETAILREQEQERRLESKGLIKPEKGSLSDISGQVVSEVFDPLAIASGWTKAGASVVNRLVSLGVKGGAYEGSSAALGQKLEEGKINRPQEIAIRTAIGVAAPPALDRVMASVLKGGTKATDNILTNLENRVDQLKTQGKSPQAALEQAVREAEQVSPKRFDKAVREDQIEILPTGVKKTVKPTQQGAIAKTADEFLGTLSTRIRNKSAEVFGVLRKKEFQIATRGKNYRAASKSFLDEMKKVKGADRAAVKASLINGGRKLSTELAEKYPALNNSLKPVGKLLDNISDDLRDVHPDIGKLDDFFPRRVKDYDALVKDLGGEAQNALDKRLDEALLRKQKASPGKFKLTEEEKIEEINKFFRNPLGGAGDLSAPKIVRSRTVDTVEDDLLKHYEDPEATLLRYLDNAAESIEVRRLYGFSKNVPEENIGQLMNRLRTQGKLNTGDVAELNDLMEARYKASRQTPNAVTANARSLTHAVLLGNPVSAVTQVGDIAVSAYKNGILNTMRGLLKSVVGSNDVSLVDLGVTRIAQEMENPSKLSKAVDRLFGATGFRYVDFTGKRTLIQSTIDKSRKLAKTPKGVEKLRKEWGEIFGKEFDTLADDLRTGKVTDNVKLLAFNTLSDVQPISLLEMPEKYLRAPNGRLFYTLKTFTLKQMDIVRNDAIKKMVSGGPREKLEGAMNLARYSLMMGMAGAATSQVKDLMRGRNASLQDFDDRFYSNLLKVYGISDFAANREGLKGVGRDVIEPAPVILPLDVTDKAVDDVKDLIDIMRGMGDDSQKWRTSRYVPVVGPWLHAYFGGGIESWEGYREKENKRKNKEEELEF